MDKPVLLLTRPAASAVRFAAKLDPVLASKAELVISPVLEIVPLPVEVALSGYQGVIFSSANGVVHGPEGKGQQAYCVGRQTSLAAQAKGWQVAYEAQDADALVAGMPAQTQGTLLHLSGTHQRGDIAKRLSNRGIPAERLEIYDQRYLPLTQAAQDALCGERKVVLPLFSPRTAAYVVQNASGMSGVFVIAMSEAVARELDGQATCDVHILREPTGSEMVRAVDLLLSGDRLP